MPNECAWVDAGEVRSLLQQFRGVQQRRAIYYVDFHKGFQAYVAEGQNAQEQDQSYSYLIVSLTTAFKHCSEEVIGIEGQLRSRLHRPNLADLLRTVQEHERTKLHMTVARQALQKAQAQRQFTWQQEAADELSGIGTEEAHACAAHACGVAPEPSRADFQRALGEATQALQAAVTGINEALEELRYAEAELSDVNEDPQG